MLIRMVTYMAHTFAKGARQFVVHEALETTSMLLLSYFFSLTPITNMGASADGAEMTTYGHTVLQASLQTL